MENGHVSGRAWSHPVEACCRITRCCGPAVGSVDLGAIGAGHGGADKCSAGMLGVAHGCIVLAVGCTLLVFAVHCTG
jgi:hypothetical protein